MSELSITSRQETSMNGKIPSKSQAKMAENIVIEFTSLPDNMKTAKVRAFYDKDGSGFLESKNASGQNEVALMQEAFGLDLSKYKSDIAKVNPQTHVGIDAKGNVIREIDKLNDNLTLYRTYSAGYMTDKDGAFESYQALDNDYKPTGTTRTWVHKPNNRVDKTGNSPLENGMNCKIHENYGPNGTKGETNDTIFNKNGEIVATDNERYLRNDKNGDVDYETLSHVIQVYEHKILTKGKNTIKATNTYDGKLEKDEDDIRYKIPQKGALKSTTYTLNGKTVQAKPIGKGRYEVTTEQGKVYYISHNGDILKAEYVRQNP